MWLMRVLTFSVSSAWTTRPGPLVDQQQVLVLIDDVQLGLEQRERKTFSSEGLSKNSSLIYN